MIFEIIEAPLCEGSPTAGSQLAFQALREGGIGSCFEHTVFTPMSVHPSVFFSAENMKSCSKVMEVNRRLYDSVTASLKCGRFPLIIGGDHSCSIGSISAVCDVFGGEKITVVYIDAHTDIHTQDTTESGYIHGMPLASAMKLCCKELTVGKSPLRGENTYIFGARSIDDGEWQTIHNQGVRLITPEDIEEKGFGACLRQMLAQIATPCIHISFDVDSLDPACFTATGYNIIKGLSVPQVKNILSSLARTGQVVSMDCTEYCPAKDKNGKDRSTLLDLLKDFAKACKVPDAVPGKSVQKTH